ncbi:MAG: 4-hydroxybenzoyl-CoA reductase subunit alpha [Rhodospirillales bacterium]|jgi:4-hydroxybenzoyl-CoA reductase subunit alpha|nr:4-hydroxybenzoyl-CoA reductase subunit alpha [Rhodospirillales bacterium]|tara:strand:+ start:2209 stop:4524 length:2316 start_codon:yes stop_codon:yes gene_type:complete
MDIAETRMNKAVGVPTPLIDGVDKVTGQAKYTADLDASNALVGKILRSRWSHANIHAIDISAALALPGVSAVLTGEDCLSAFGVLPITENEYALAKGRVRYKGDPIAAVAAIDDKTAEKALSLIELDVEELPAYYTPAEARQPGAVDIHQEKPGNLLRDQSYELGDVDGGFADADLLSEGAFSSTEVNHMQLERHAALADYDPDRGWLTVQSVSQVPYYLHRMLAQCLGMDRSRIRFIKPFVGGGFGARAEALNFEIITAMLAKAAGGKVRMELTREDCFLSHRGRPQSELNIKLGLKKDGEITACSAEVVQAGGAYASYGVITILYAGAAINGIYEMPAFRYQGSRVFTNLPACGAMRGHGTVATRFAFETLMNEMAEELGLDPFTVRRKNLLTVPCETINGVKIDSYGLPQCLDWVEAASGWKDRFGKLAANGNGRRGLGLGCSHMLSGAPKSVHRTGEPHALINLKLDFDGGITVLTGAPDIGQGSSTILVQSVAEVLGVDIDRVRIIEADSALTPKDNGAFSSRITFMCGNAAIDAANKLKEILVRAAAKKLEAEAVDIECLGEVYRVAGSQDPGIPFADVVEQALVDSGTITVKGAFTVPEEYQGTVKFRGSAVGPSMGFSFGATVAEVSVDEDTGMVKVEQLWTALDCGYAINPLAVEGQIEGQVWMAVGQAISEELKYQNGLPLQANALDYKVPTIVESPPIEVKIIESKDPNGPFGAKESSEGALAGAIAAVGAAIYDAIGIRLHDLPFSPERVLAALEKKRD